MPDQQVITAGEVAQATAERKSLVATFAERYGIEPNRMMATLKATAFRQRQGDPEITNEQMAALLIVANAHSLNPFTREIFAFPSQGGIVPVVSVDGWAALVNRHPQFNGMEFDVAEDSCTCTIFRKDRDHPTKVTEYLSECRRPSPAWSSHPKRMLRHRSMVQCARIAFSFAGVYEPEEAEAIVEAEAQEIDVTPGNEVIPADGKIGAKKLRVVVEGMLEAVASQDGKALTAIWGDLTNEQRLFVWDQLRSWERSAIKKLQEAAKPFMDAEHLAPWAVGAIGGSADPEALETAWRLVQDAYAEQDLEVPLDVQTVYTDRKAELGG